MKPDKHYSTSVSFSVPESLQSKRNGRRMAAVHYGARMIQPRDMKSLENLEMKHVAVMFGEW